MTMTKREIVSTRVELEIPIEASRKQVWKAITEEINLWWRKDFYASSKTKQFVLEPRLGGRMYEDTGNGAGLVWYTVLGIEPLESLYFVGYLTPAFGGPATSILEVGLKDSGKHTILKISDAILGPEADPSEKEAGWRMLFEEGLKMYVEK